MKIQTTKNDAANALASGVIEQKALDSKAASLTQKAAKTLHIDGFRKGKVPVSIVRTRYGKQIAEDAEQEVIKDFINEAFKELGVKEEDTLGSPMFLKFDKNENGIDVEVRFALRPEFDVAPAKGAVPSFDAPSVSDSEIDEQLAKFAKNYGELHDITDRALQEGDIANIDFEGFVDGKAFEGGKAEGYNLEIGSKAFIPGFEEQLVGMRIGDSKDISVTFPKDYGAQNLAGKDARFAIKLHSIKARTPVPIDDALAKKLLPKDEDASLQKLKERIKEQIASDKKAKLYNETLKEKFIENLLEAFAFDLPENIIEQEMDMLFRSEVDSMERAELEALQGKREEIKERREKHKEKAQRNVKLTLIIDALARANKLGISEQELFMRLYNEAMFLRQDPKTLLDYYQQSGYLPALQMALLEDKVLTFLLEKSIDKE